MNPNEISVLKSMGIEQVLKMAALASNMNRQFAGKFAQLSWANDTAARALRVARASGNAEAITEAENGVFEVFVSTGVKQFALMDALSKAHAMASALAYAEQVGD